MMRLVPLPTSRQLPVQSPVTCSSVSIGPLGDIASALMCNLQAILTGSAGDYDQGMGIRAPGEAGWAESNSNYVELGVGRQVGRHEKIEVVRGVQDRLEPDR